MRNVGLSAIRLSDLLQEGASADGEQQLYLEKFNIKLTTMSATSLRNMQPASVSAPRGEEETSW